MTTISPIVTLLALGATAIASAADPVSMAVRPEAFFSSDADGNEVAKTSMGWDWRHRDREHWTGIDVQHARFAGEGWSHEEERIYGRAGGTIGSAPSTDDTWRWQARLGTNGHTSLGGVTLNTDGPRRCEIFFERETLETEAGIARGQMYNLLGMAIDHPFGARLSGTALSALQTFGDGNERVHVRGNLAFALIPQWGISVQARARYYHNSEPYLGGYYSPQWYAERLGVLSMRRFVHGFTWRALGGFGSQRTEEEGWKRARLLEASFETPRWRQSWLRLVAGYTDTPVTSDIGSTRYSYRYGMLQAALAF